MPVGAEARSNARVKHRSFSADSLHMRAVVGRCDSYLMPLASRRGRKGGGQLRVGTSLRWRARRLGC
eukprot:scaffold301_cov393-Prasinococcus_capsulatus_cf.AAC.5